MTPYISTCERNVTPSENYICPVLTPGRQYTFKVNAFNNRNQEGRLHFFTVQPQGNYDNCSCILKDIIYVAIQ